MSSAELKKKLIKKIQETSDEKLLLEATKLLEIQLSEIETPYILSPEMNEAIDEAKNQLKTGQFLSHEQANKEIGEWLEK